MTKAAVPATKTNQVATYIDAAAILLNIPINAEYRAGVVANLERLLDLSEQFISFPLPQSTEAASVFRP